MDSLFAWCKQVLRVVAQVLAVQAVLGQQAVSLQKAANRLRVSQAKVSPVPSLRAVSHPQASQVANLKVKRADALLIHAGMDVLRAAILPQLAQAMRVLADVGLASHKTINQVR
jgi:predicted XRE-type DNA-binding protein